MANRVVAPNLFAPNPPNWSLQLLDANANNATGAINDSSLGSVNGPLADTGSANNYQVACTFGSPSTLNNGMTVFFTPANTNTGPSTLTVSPLSSAPIVSTSSTALAGGELAAGTTIGVVCDGTQFRIFNLPSPSSIWSVRLRSYNAFGNPNFEVDQRQCGTAPVMGTGFAAGPDRWSCAKLGGSTMAATAWATGIAAPYVLVPGTSFAITQKALRITLTAAQASLAAGDLLFVSQQIEGPFIRELFSDSTSISVLARTSGPSISVGVGLRDPAPISKSLVKLCTVPGNTWTLLTFPNIPVFPAGNFVVTPGAIGLNFNICLAAGSTYMASANDIWTSSNTLGAVGQTNFASLPVNTFIDFAFLQLEPGAVCTTLMDLPFSQNYHECLRYFAKSLQYAQLPAAAVIGTANLTIVTGNTVWAAGDVLFPRPLARAPTCITYASDGTANNSNLWGTSTKVAVSSVTANEKGINAINVAAGQTGGAIMTFNYSADTLW